MVFQQRNGRVDCYGQERTPRIVYLVAESANETIHGDTRILEVLERKDEQAYRDIGDPSAFMNVHDVQAEEEVTRRAVAGGEGAERFDARLASDETVFVLSGLVPNRRSHPLVYEWIGVAYRGGRFQTLTPFDDLLARTGLGRGPVANRGSAVHGGRPPAALDALQHRLPEAVAKAREWIIGRRNAFEKRINAKLDHAVAALDELKARRLRQVELQLAGSGQAEAFERARVERSRHEVEEIFDEYLEWIQETMTTEPWPWIKVVRAMTGEGSGEGSGLIWIHDTDHA